MNKLLTDAGPAVGRQLKAFVTVAHKGAVGVEAGVAARFILALIHICAQRDRVSVACRPVCSHACNTCVYVCVCVP